MEEIDASGNLGREADRGYYVALLRGINVGGKNKLAMPELAELFVGAGCFDVITYIQSGNVVFRPPGHRDDHLADRLSERILARFGIAVPIVLRTGDELAAAIAANPFVAAGADSRALHVAFLADHPDDRKVALLDPQRSPPDAFAVVSREIFLHCPDGLARTKLTNAYFDRTLGTMSTVRNWATVLKLLELASRPYDPRDRT